MGEHGSFGSRIDRSPRPYEPDRGTEASQLFPELAPDIRTVITGAAGCSPYLRTLCERERDWLTLALSGSPESAMDGLLKDIRTLTQTELSPGLREAKRRAAVLIALADVAGIWHLEQVTGALTKLADAAVDRAMATLIAQEAARGKLPDVTPDIAETGAGMVALAMGKMGAGELNYSSDIDLICLFDETRFDPDLFHDVRSAFVRVTRRMAALLSEVTANGYVFRTDLRLRPDPAVTPVCLSMAAAERYYESVGRTWERAAYIKARPAAGDLEAGAAFLERLIPFVWRRHLDFAAIQDAHDMRLKIREHKALGGALRLEGHDLKLGSGGIREIEFFTQTRQIIAGGRDPDLRRRQTVEGLQALKAAGWVGEVDGLIDDYRAHREIEHRLQMVNDQQTHKLPTTPDGFERLAAFVDKDVDTLRGELIERLQRVARTTEDFFRPDEKTQSSPDISPALAEIVARWPDYPALRSARAAEIFARVKPQILNCLGRAARPEEALVHIDGFLAGLPAGVQVFSLFDANPQLIDLIVDIAATSPALASYLSRHSSVLDAVIGGGFFAEWPELRWLKDDLGRHLEQAGDYESQLLEARRWRNEWHFRVGVHHLRGLITAEQAGAHYADIAEAVVASVFDPVIEEFSRKHGPPPGRGATILGMGSLGSRALNATSDLDLIVIYDPDGTENSQGRRPLDARSYYARLTQSLVTAITAPMGPGKLYEVDMRLRPSGRKGPVATGLNSFKSYQRDEAWTWEHLALTRARPIAGSAALGAEVEAFRREILSGSRDQSKVLRDVASMRKRLADAKPGHGVWDVKLGPGRAQDIALLAQAGALLSGSPERAISAQISAGRNALDLTGEEARDLTKTHDLLWQVQAAARLMTDAAFDPVAVGAGGQSFLLRETGHGDMAELENALIRQTARADAIITARMPEAEDGTTGDG